MAEAKILIIEDDDELRGAVEKKLTNEGFEISTAADGATGLVAFDQNKPDLIILDLMLPDMDGFTVCRELRESSDVFILILTAKIEGVDQVKGLELGADDYVTKPFSLRALTARIRALLRRQRAITEKGEALVVGAIAPDVIHDDIWVDYLTPEEAAGEAAAVQPAPAQAGTSMTLANPGDFWRIDQRWHLIREPKAPVNEAQLKRNLMGIVDAGYIVEILGIADWVGVIKEVYLYKATTMEQVDEPIAHGYLLTNACKNAELLQQASPL